MAGLVGGVPETPQGAKFIGPYAGKARVRSKKQVRQIAASIQRFGFTSPVLISDDGEIIAGHGRVLAAQEPGISTVLTIRLPHLSADERRAYVLADNKLALNAGWDADLLAIELQGLIDLDFDLSITGFSMEPERPSDDPQPGRLTYDRCGSRRMVTMILRAAFEQKGHKQSRELRAGNPGYTAALLVFTLKGLLPRRLRLDDHEIIRCIERRLCIRIRQLLRGVRQGWRRLGCNARRGATLTDDCSINGDAHRDQGLILPKARRSM